MHFAMMRKKNHAIQHLIAYVIFKSVISLLKINLNYLYSGKQIYIGIRIQNDWILQVMLFQISWRLFTAQLFKSHRFFMPAFMLHKCTHALNYLLLKFVYKKTLLLITMGWKWAYPYFLLTLFSCDISSICIANIFLEIPIALKPRFIKPIYSW